MTPQSTLGQAGGRCTQGATTSRETTPIPILVQAACSTRAAWRPRPRRVGGARDRPHTPLSHRQIVSQDINWEGHVWARHVKTKSTVGRCTATKPLAPTGHRGRRKTRFRGSRFLSLCKRNAVRGEHVKPGASRFLELYKEKRNVAPGFQARRSIQGTSSCGTQRAKRWALLQTSPAGPVMQYLCAAPPRSLERL